MYFNSKSILLGIGTLAMVSGCTTILGKRINSQVEFKGASSRTFQFSKAGYVNKEDISQAIADALIPASIYGKVKGYREPGGSHIRYQGVKTYTRKDNKFVKAVIQSNYDTLIEERGGKFKLTFSDYPDQYVVKMDCPSYYSDKATMRGGAFGSINGNPLPKNQVITAFNHMCNFAEPVVQKEKVITGEIDSKYKPIDIIANFDRILPTIKTGVHQDVVMKAGYYQIDLPDNTLTTLKVNVYPYRSGSKTQYQFTYRYENDKDGHSTYSMKDIQRVTQRIQSIING